MELQSDENMDDPVSAGLGEMLESTYDCMHCNEANNAWEGLAHKSGLASQHRPALFYPIATRLFRKELILVRRIHVLPLQAEVIGTCADL